MSHIVNFLSRLFIVGSQIGRRMSEIFCESAVECVISVEAVIGGYFFYGFVCMDDFNFCFFEALPVKKIVDAGVVLVFESFF